MVSTYLEFDKGQWKLREIGFSQLVAMKEFLADSFFHYTPKFHFFYYSNAPNSKVIYLLIENIQINIIFNTSGLQWALFPFNSLPPQKNNNNNNCIKILSSIFQMGKKLKYIFINRFGVSLIILFFFQLPCFHQTLIWCSRITCQLKYSWIRTCQNFTSERKQNTF